MLDPTGETLAGPDNSYFVSANVYDVRDPQTPVTRSPHRMVFIAGTDPARRLLSLERGQRMHVMGIPRVNLTEVAALSGDASIKMALPYEMIIVAVLEDEKAASNGVHP
jgi:hypothetical protein